MSKLAALAIFGAVIAVACTNETGDDVCGDGVVSPSEECDDRNDRHRDGCAPFCVIEAGWSCSGQPSGCFRTDVPVPPNCGDGLLDGGEACDDGNLLVGDGCDAACTVEDGWGCSGSPSACVADGLPADTGRPGTDIADASDSHVAPSDGAGDVSDAGSGDANVGGDTGERADTDDARNPDGGADDLGPDPIADTDDDAGTDDDADTDDTAVVDAPDVGDALDGSDTPPDSPPPPCDEVGCTHLDEPCAVGVCDPDTGACAASVFPDGAGCDDGNACTEGDRCTDGVCGGPPRSCHEGPCQISLCDPHTGDCVPRDAEDGTACDDDPSDCRSGACAVGECLVTTVDDCSDCGAEGVGLCVEGECGIVSPEGPELFDFEGTVLPVYRTGGDADWTVDGGVAHSGGTAARSGDIGNGDVSWVATDFELLVDGAVSFWYRVDSEPRYDFLIAIVDGAERDRWAGDIDWSLARYELPAGAHTLELRYDKDGSLSTGDDAAWVDDLHFEGRAPCPTDACGAGVWATGSCTQCPLLDEGASCDDDPNDCVSAFCGGGVCLAAGITDCGACGADGLSLCAGGICGGLSSEGREWAFESSALPPEFSTGGWRGWSTTTGEAHSGDRSVGSGDIDDLDESWLRMSHAMPFDGEIRFWFRTSTETCCDDLFFRVDREELGSWAGTEGWTEAVFPLTAGTHDFEWSYEKDFSVSTGDDRVWIDDIVIRLFVSCAGTECSPEVHDGATCVTCPLDDGRPCDGGTCGAGACE